MKKIITLLALMFLMRSITHATVIMDSVTAGDSLRLFATWHDARPHTDTVTSQMRWCTFIGGTISPCIGMTSVYSDSIRTRYTWRVPIAGSYYVQIYNSILDSAGNTTIDTTGWYLATVTLPYDTPTIAYAGAGQPNPYGGKEILNINAGNTTTLVRRHISFGSLHYDPQYGYVADSFYVTGGQQTYTDIITGVSTGHLAYPFALYYDARNVVGTVRTGYDSMTTTLLSGQAPWISNHANNVVVSAVDSSVSMHYQVLDQSSACASIIRWKNAHSTYWTDSTDLGNIPGTTSVIDLPATMSNLRHDSTYVHKVCVTNSFGTACSYTDTFTMVSAVASFDILTDTSSYAGGLDQGLTGVLILPNGIASVGWVFTTLADNAYNTPLQSGFRTFSGPTAPGVHVLRDTARGLTDRAWYRYKYYGSNNLGNSVPPTSSGDNIFQFKVPVILDTLDPVMHVFYATLVGNAVVSMYQYGTDDRAVTSYVITRNSSVIATIPGSQTTYDDLTVTPNTTYTYTVIAKDNAGHSSNMMSFTVTTPGNTTTEPIPTLTSMESVICLNYTGEYDTTIVVHGTNFDATTEYNIVYNTDSINGFAPDQGTGTLISSTQYKIRLWRSSPDTAIVKVKNAGTVYSNPLQTYLRGDCGTATGISQVRKPSNAPIVFHTYPSPFDDVLNVSIGTSDKSTSYSYTVSNTVGQQIREGQFKTGINKISLQQEPAGMYFLEISDSVSKTKTTQKIMKQ